MDIYNGNLELIKKMSSELYRIVTDEQPNYYVEIEDALEGDNYILKHNNVSAYVHSIYNIEHEMEMMCKNLDGTEKTIVVFGVGYGHIFKYIKEKFPLVERVLVIEPSLQTFVQFLSKVSLKEVNLDMNVAYLVNRPIDFASKVISKYFEKNKEIKIIYNIAYYMAFTDYCSTIISEVKDAVLKVRANYNVSVGLLNLWLVNAFSNWEYCNNGIELIKDYFKGKTVVIVGAGPSLDKNVSLINELKDKAIVIAIGSAIKILDSKGIVPHFRMAYDGAPSEMQAFNEIDTNAAPLIFSSKLFYKALLQYEGMKLQMSLDRDQLDRFIDKKRGDKNPLTVISGSSIVICAVYMAEMLGAARIVLMGIDMAAKGNSIYAKGIGEDKEKVIIDKNMYMESENIYGETVYVHKGLYTALLSLEEAVRDNPQIQFIDATEGGVVKKGMRIMTLRDVIDQLLQKDTQIKNMLAEVESKYIALPNVNPDIEKYVPVIKGEIENVDFILENYTKNLKKVKKELEKGYISNKVDKMLDGISNFQQQLNDNDLFSVWISNALFFVLQGIDSVYSYNGNDKIIKHQNEVKRLLGHVAEIKNYIRIIQAFINSMERGTFKEEILNS